MANNHLIVLLLPIFIYLLAVKNKQFRINSTLISKIIISIKEKPIHNFFVNAGIYVLQPEIVQDFQLEQYCDMPALLNTLIDKEKTVSMFPIHEYWLDIGQSEDFCKAEKEYLNYF